MYSAIALQRSEGLFIARESGQSAEVSIWLCKRQSDVLRHVKASCRSYIGELSECANRIASNFITKHLEALRIDNLGTLGNSFNLPFMPEKWERGPDAVIAMQDDFLRRSPVEESLPNIGKLFAERPTHAYPRKESPKRTPVEGRLRSGPEFAGSSATGSRVRIQRPRPSALL